MSDMSSPLADAADQPSRARAMFWNWAAFVVGCVAVMILAPALGAVAFHFVWISMAIVYGVQGWSARRTITVLAVVTPVTALAMAWFIRAEGAEWTELAEVPLMAAVFLVMVWHVRRRAEALARARESAVCEQRANDLKELFVRNCSHEMRTPITVARGYAEMARAQLAGESGEADLEIVMDELEKLAGLSRRLLVLADVYDSASFELDTVDLASLVRRTAARWRPAAARHWIVEARDAEVDADESRIEAALDALVENAIKFTCDADTITLRCYPSGHGAVLEVEDSGIGFERSAAPDAPKTSGQPGTGLGLAIVRAIAEGHGGQLTVHPDGRSGARLLLGLPRVRAAHQHA